MKSHPSKVYDKFHGVNLSYAARRIDDASLAVLNNAWCDMTGRIEKAFGYYPVTTADAFGITTASSPTSKLWVMEKYRGKDGNARALAVLGGGLYRSTPNSLYDSWAPIAFTDFQVAPDLNSASAIAFRNRYGYHQNGTDIPFRVKMEEDDGSDPSTEAEVLGLRAPCSAADTWTESAGSRFPEDSQTTYAVTFVYGDRGESGPSPFVTVQAAANAEYFEATGVPIGPPGVTGRRIYRTRIGQGKATASSSTKNIDFYPSLELFRVGEFFDNTSTTFRDTSDDTKLDYTQRVPPPRPLPPRSKYQKLHLDRLFWANLTEHPWVMNVCSVEGNVALTAATVTISNSGNGTITLKQNIGAGLVTIITINNYKTLTLSAIRALILSTWTQFGFSNAQTGTNFFARVQPGVDDTRMYTFAEVTEQNIYKNANVFSFEAIDGSETFPNRVMFSDLAFVEEINPFNSFDISKDDAYPITNLQRDDFTLCVATQDKWWLVSGSFIPNELFVPDFTVSASRAEHGSFCTRPDACCSTPYGIFFISIAGVRLLRTGSDAPAGIEIDDLVLQRIVNEPRARDNPCMIFWNDTIYIAFPADVTV